MTIRTRKFFGTIALLVLVIVWSLMGMTVAQTFWLVSSGLLQAIFYVVAGIEWGLPARMIIIGMIRQGTRSSGDVDSGPDERGCLKESRAWHAENAAAFPNRSSVAR